MSSFISEINKLKNIQQHLERHGNTFIDTFAKLNRSTELYELRSENQKSRQAQQEKIKNDVANIITPLKMMNDSLKKKNLSKLDIKTVRKNMTGIQSNIKNLNDTSQISLDELRKEEHTLISELQTFQDKIDKWEKRNNNSIPKSLRRTVSTPANISKEVKTFLEFVTSSGGHENGWTLDDHALFVRLRNKFKDNNKLAEVIHAMLPDISEKEVIAHEKWYIKYLELREKQKNSIKNWRASKNNAQKSPATNSPEKVGAKNTHIDFLEKEMIQEKLQAWKSEKLQQSKFEYEQKQQELAKKREEETAKRLKQQELREQVNSWKNSKKHAEEEEKQKKEEEVRREQKERALRANKLIKEYQNQDELFIQHKLQKLQSKLPPILTQKKTEPKSRDRSRLLQPTQQWIMKKYTDSISNENYTSNMNVQAIPKLRTPEWRKYVM